MNALEPNPGGLTYQQSMLAREQRFIERFKMHAAKTAQLQSQIKALDKIRAAEERQVTKFDFRVTLSIRRPSGGD